jgi:hypothetical protein
LELNASRPRTEDLEAILRRCDHSGNQTLSYADYNELVAFLDTYTVRSYEHSTSKPSPYYKSSEDAPNHQRKSSSNDLRESKREGSSADQALENPAPFLEERERHI